MQGLDKVVLGTLNANDRNFYLRQHRPGVDVRERPIAELQASFNRDWIVHCGVDVKCQRRRHLSRANDETSGNMPQ